MNDSRKGIIFSILILSFTASVILLFLNFSFFTSEAETSTFEDTTLGTQFAAVERDFGELIGLQTTIEKGPSFTTINFTDRLPRSPGFQDSVNAYEDFLKNHLNLSYNTTANFSTFVDDPHIKIKGTKGIYSYTNDEKDTVELLQKNDNTSFVKKYNITLRPRDSGFHASTITPTREDTDGNLRLIVRSRNSSGVFDVYDKTIARDNDTRITVGFNGPSHPVGEVDIVAGDVQDFNSSISIAPTFDIAATTLLKFQDSQIS
jgi:hypothetical protein